MLLSCRNRIEETSTAVAEAVTIAVVLYQGAFNREINVVIVTYPMALRVLKVLVYGSGRDEVPLTPYTPVMAL